jgi:predicted Zn-dependent protease
VRYRLFAANFAKVGLSTDTNATHDSYMNFIARYSLPLLITFMPCANAELPELGDPTLKNFSRQDEVELGQAFYYALRANLDFIDDLQINHYVKSLGQTLASHSDAAGNQFHFFVINADSINAFAGPNATLGINSGLMLKATNESQLAGVIAHEISHVSQRHIARAIDRSGNVAVASFATILAAILLGSQDPQAAQAVLFTGIAGTQQAAINFTRQNEYEADRIGIGILGRAGINPQGMVEFFETLLADGRGTDIEYLRTHPLNVSRVSEARNRIADEHRLLPNDSDDFRFCKARLEVLISRKPATFIARQADDDDIIGQYQRAIALIASHDNDAAVQQLKPLLLKSNHPWIKLALAQAHEQRGDSKTALNILEQLASYYPDYLPVTLAYANALTANKQAQQSITVLKHQLQLDDDAIVHKALAFAYYSNGQNTAALEATGNQYQREGYYELAIQQYEHALQMPDVGATGKQRLTTKIDELKAKSRNKFEQ